VDGLVRIRVVADVPEADPKKRMRLESFEAGAPETDAVAIIVVHAPSARHIQSQQKGETAARDQGGLDDAEAVLQAEQQHCKQRNGASARVRQKYARSQDGSRQQSEQQIAGEAPFLPTKPEKGNYTDKKLGKIVRVVKDAKAAEAEE
jgi:flagellar motility protein MotE (MotC chaperone)